MYPTTMEEGFEVDCFPPLRRMCGAGFTVPGMFDSVAAWQTVPATCLKKNQGALQGW
jgi:hypothetical protein